MGQAQHRRPLAHRGIPPSADSALVAARTPEELTRRRYSHRRSESLPTNKVQAHRHLFFEKIATENIQAIVEKWLQANPVAPTQAPMPASQCASGATPAIITTRTAEAPPQSPTQSEAPGQTQGPAGVPLPLSSDEDDEAMDFLNSRKRLREESGDEDDHAPRKQTATTSPDEESHASQGSEEMSGSEFRTVMNSEGASSTGDMTTSAPTGGLDPTSLDGAGTHQHPTTASTVDLPPATTESPANPPSDASAAMEVVEEVPTRTAAGGNIRKEAPYTAKDFLLTSSTGATHTNSRKKGKKPTKKRPPATASEGTAANLPQPFSKAPTAVDTTRKHSSAVGSPPDTEGFQVVTTKSARRRARDLAAAAALPVDPAIVGTVLFRPSAPGGTFSGSPRLILAHALSTRPGVAAIRVNHKRNIVAADATTRECLEQLLNIKELKGIPVTAKEPADHKTSTGFLHGVDGEPAVDSLLPGIKSAVPVLSAAREGRTVTLRFAGPVPPEHVSLFLVRFPVRPARPRPLQCRQCGRFGHVKESCSWPGSCIRCGRTHLGESCKQTRCVNCGGPHSADTPECPRWQEQRKIATIMASSPTILSRRTVAAAVREEIREARSFASVVKGHPAPPPPPARPIPAPRKSRRQPLQGLQSTSAAAHMALPVATGVPEAPPAAAATPAAQPAAIAPGGRPAVPMAPAALPDATVELPPADPAYQIVATLLNTLRALLERLRSQPGSRMGGLCLLYHQMVPDPPVPVASPPPHHQTTRGPPLLGRGNKATKRLWPH
ncbi:hypothetical protein HPB51_028409 [Rhipicephalus microplus]|uniref:CCHC-type domain-containing protein n=1 Tax=Rhipicephalus microplus TaxID=6941 RepID=A0A9J6CXE6_RHIMP|nr:hypothetical protein HPB51_028409 [Rhipicephalus microplus]